MRRRRLIPEAVFVVLTAATALPVLGAADAPLRLPLTILRNNPVTTAEVAGHEIQIGVDTGGGVLGLTQQALTQAGAIELPGKPTVWTDSSGQSHEARRFRVPQLRVGGRTFTNVDAIEAHEIPNGPAVANVLGREFLKQFIVIIDYPGSLMTLLSPDTPDAEAEAMGCKGARASFERSSEPGLVITRVKVDEATLRLGWDTGATYSTLPAQVATDHRLTLTPPAGKKPPFYNTKRLLIGETNLGPFDFVVLPLGLPSDVEGMLGYNVFAKHVVCLNYARGEVRVRRS